MRYCWGIRLIQALSLSRFNKDPTIRRGKLAFSWSGNLLMVISEITSVEGNWPLQIEGFTEYGKKLFVHYRYGLLRVWVGEEEVLCEASEHSWEDVENHKSLSLEEIQEKIIRASLSFPENISLRGICTESRSW